MFSNGEKEDEIAIESMWYESYLHNDLEIIISKKEKKEDTVENNLLFDE